MLFVIYLQNIRYASDKFNESDYPAFGKTSKLALLSLNGIVQQVWLAARLSLYL